MWSEEKESLFRVAGRSYIMVQKEESVEGLRNKNSLRLIGAQSGGGVCRQPGVSRATRRLRPGQGWWWFSGREEARTRMEDEI